MRIRLRNFAAAQCSECAHTSCESTPADVCLHPIDILVNDLQSFLYMQHYAALLWSDLQCAQQRQSFACSSNIVFV